MGHSGTSEATSDFGASRVPNRRLDSWKEIAAFFRRDERTVKRWEKERGLPVHRLQDSPKGRVYAFTDELTQWMTSPASSEPLASGREPADVEVEAPASQISAAGTHSSPPDEPSPQNLRRRASDRVNSARKKWLVGAVALVLVTGGFGYYKQVSFHSKEKWLAGRDSTNPEAREFYLKGRYEWDKRTPDSLNKAVDYFTQAIVHDANYAQAYVGLADCYNLLREFGTMPPQEAYPRALAAASKAVELDDSSAEAHTSLAFATFYGNLDSKDAEREFKRALVLNPNYATAHHWYATFLLAVGRYSEALNQIEVAQQLDPASTAILADKGFILLYADQKDEGIALLKQLESTEPTFPSTYTYLRQAYLMNEDYPAYLGAWEKMARLSRDERELAMVTAGQKGFAASGRQGMLQNVLKKQQEFYAQGQLSPYAVASTYALLCDRPRALQYLRIAYQQHEAALVGMGDKTLFACLYQEPAYRELVAKVGLQPVQ